MPDVVDDCRVWSIVAVPVCWVYVWTNAAIIPQRRKTNVLYQNGFHYAVEYWIARSIMVGSCGREVIEAASDPCTTLEQWTRRQVLAAAYQHKLCGKINEQQFLIMRAANL